MELLDSVFEGNDAVDAANSTLEPCDAFVRAAGGAIYSSDGSVHASATRLSNNSAAAWGGALQAVRSTIEIGTGSRFEANRALSAGGGAITAGSTWNFQFWYRDPQGGPNGFNLSDGMRVTFCP